MNLVTSFLAGLVFEVPCLLVQVLLARAAGRRWPRFRWVAYGLAALPFLLTALAFPGVRLGLVIPGWLYFAVYFWLFAALPAFCAFWLVRLVGAAAGIRKKRVARQAQERIDEGRRRALQTAAYCAAAVPLGAALYGAFVERTRFEVREVSVPVAGLPADLERLRFLQISDIHLSAFFSRRDLSRVVAAANELQPDLVFHTGDFISSAGDPLVACMEELALIRNIAGAFGCLGNHEIYAEASDAATAEAARKNIRILRGQAQSLRFGNTDLHISGVDYQPLYRRDHYLEGANALIKRDAFNLLLSHNPDVFPTAASMGFDLTLAGHTHGGQIRVELLRQDINPARFYTPYVAGLYQAGDRSCYVTRGVGTIGMPARFGSPPEITLLRLTRA